jgi:hypothetical protein
LNGETMLKVKLEALVAKWRTEFERLSREMELVSGLRYYSSMSPDEQREWTDLRTRAYGYLGCANELQKELDNL